MYLQHTANLADGHPYAESGYVLNPATMSAGTESYPPGLPVLLLPIYLIAGLQLTVMKILIVLTLFMSIWVLWRMTRDEMAVAFSVAMLVDVSFTPYLWESKETIQADFPFLVPLFLALWVMQRTRLKKSGPAQWTLLGFLMYAAVSFRSVGLALPIVLLLFDLLDGRKVVPSRRFWIPTAVFVLLVVVQGILLPVESGTYGSVFVEQLRSPVQLVTGMIHNFKYYVLACAGRLLLSNGHGTLWADILLLVSVGPFLVGLVHRLKRITVLEIFLVVYVGILLVWPFRQPNYLIPAIPLLSYYFFVGLERLAERFAPKSKPAVATVAVAVLALTFGMNYATKSFSDVSNDVMSRASLEFYDFVRTETPADALILSREPREVALFTGRHSTPPNYPGESRDYYTDAEVATLRDYMASLGVNYLAAGPKGVRYHPEVLPLWQLTEQPDSSLVPEFGNDEWRFFRVVAP